MFAVFGKAGPSSTPFLTKLGFVFAVFGVGYVCFAAAAFGGVRYVVTTLIGVVAGVGLYHAAFGFTAAWRRVVAERRGQGLRAQMLLLVIACVFTFPLIAYGPPIDGVGLRSGAWVLPFGITAMFGSFIFGMGMQLGGGCGSGTLFTVGGGSTRMLITLVFFIVGSLFGTWNLPHWADLPRLEAFSFVQTLGPGSAIVVISFMAGLVYWISQRLELHAHGGLEEARLTQSIVRGPWSHKLGIAALVFVTVATMLTLGRPWGITSGFALWGAKMATLFGVDVVAWPYWSGGRASSIQRSVFADSTSIMNFGLIFGAMLAAVAAGKFKPLFRLNRTEILTAIVGGLLMGWGARLAYGCNIGAYLGGIVSGSLHGWLWGIFAFAGSSMMVRIKLKLRW